MEAKLDMVLTMFWRNIFSTRITQAVVLSTHFFLAVGCAHSPQNTELNVYGLPNEVILESGVVIGGAPSEDSVRKLAAAGYQRVIDLRLETEDGFAEEKELVESLGMTFVSIPVSGDDALTEARARRLADVIIDPSKTVVHCASGNRAGALWALAAYYVQGKSPKEALAEGQRVGLTSLYDSVKSKLEAACAQAARSDCQM